MGGRANNHGQARKPDLVSARGNPVGIRRSTSCPSRASKSARASGAIPRRHAIPNSRDKQARLDRRRRLAWLFSHAQPAHHRTVRKSTNRSERLRRALMRLKAKSSQTRREKIEVLIELGDVN